MHNLICGSHSHYVLVLFYSEACVGHGLLSQKLCQESAHYEQLIHSLLFVWYATVDIRHSTQWGLVNKEATLFVLSSSDFQVTLINSNLEVGNVILVTSTCNSWSKYGLQGTLPNNFKPNLTSRLIWQSPVFDRNRLVQLYRDSVMNEKYFRTNYHISDL